jgi:serine protease Do
MCLAHQLLDFFDGGYTVGHSQRPYSLLNFVKKYPELLSQAHKILRYCRRLENEGLLNHMGFSGDHPYYRHHYYTARALYDKDISLYGSYDLLVEGFLSLRDRFKPLTLAISVKKKNGDLSLGSGFVYNSYTVITARHCLENLDKVSILDIEGSIIPVSRVYYPIDEKLDLAILRLGDDYFNNYETITITPKEAWQGSGEMDGLNFIGRPSIIVFAPGKILEDVLTLGYPPISGFESILIADTRSINSSILRTSKGQVLAEAQKYNHDIEYFLINAKVKGGNSGGPVLDRLGRVVGMIVEIPTDFENHDEIDKLGYGLALPARQIKRMLDALDVADSSIIIEQAIEQLEGNSFKIK